MRIVIVLAFVSFFAGVPVKAGTVSEMLAGCRLVANAPITDGNVVLPNNPAVQHCWGAISVLQELSRWVVEGRALPLLAPGSPPRTTQNQVGSNFCHLRRKVPRPPR